MTQRSYPKAKRKRKIPDPSVQFTTVPSTAEFRRHREKTLAIIAQMGRQVPIGNQYYDPSEVRIGKKGEYIVQSSPKTARNKE